jgi:hypothetical protein
MRGKRDPCDYPPGHFLWFSKDVLRCFLHREGFGDILIVPINISLGSLAQNIEYVITGSSFIRKKLKVKILRRTKDSAFLKYLIVIARATFIFKQNGDYKCQRLSARFNLLEPAVF